MGTNRPIKNNKLNELTGTQWLKFQKSWFIHNPPPRSEQELLHPAKFPEDLCREFIEFFTKQSSAAQRTRAAAPRQISRGSLSGVY